MQRIGESRWRPLELCWWPEQTALPAKGKEYPGLGYKRLRGQPAKAQQQQQQQQPAVAQCVGGRAPRAPSGMQLSSRFSRTGSALQAQTASSETGAVRSGYTIDPAYAAGAAYLKAIGFTNAAEIARILDVARILSVEEDMQPVVDFLLSVHVSKGDMLKIISAHPPVLSYSVPQRLQPFVEYLQELGIQDVGAAISNRPSLLGLDANQQIRSHSGTAVANIFVGVAAGSHMALAPAQTPTHSGNTLLCSWMRLRWVVYFK
ncbi:hypothetical protein QJQ45_000769 [Haematococcus lacustris]|nr:hypothetical protein QJQ45_000769 [Haematococcus lacustris]